MATLQQIANHLNSSIVPAIMGENFTINPNLDNIVDLGTAISAMTANDFKDYLNTFVSAVAKTKIDNREYAPNTVPMAVNSQEYGGLVQSLKADLVSASDSQIYDLQDGTVYNDVNTYFGTAINNKVFTKSDTWRIVRSIPRSMYKKAFNSAEGVSQLVALIENSVDRSIAVNETSLKHNLLSTACLKGVKVNLVTAYNAAIATITTGNNTVGTMGADDVDLVTDKPTSVTTANCLYNKHFVKWAVARIKDIMNNSKYLNKKYNDGTIETFLRQRDVISVFNDIAINNIEMTLDKSTEIQNLYTVPFWNVQSTNVIPDIATATAVKYNDGISMEVLTADDNKTLSNVIGIVYDKNALGYTVTPLSVRTSYNEAGDFYNPFMDNNVQYHIDTRDTFIVFTLN